jgi:hypothetical protein
MGLWIASQTEERHDHHALVENQGPTREHTSTSVPSVPEKASTTNALGHLLPFRLPHSEAVIPRSGFGQPKALSHFRDRGSNNYDASRPAGR